MSIRNKELVTKWRVVEGFNQRANNINMSRVREKQMTMIVFNYGGGQAMYYGLSRRGKVDINMSREHVQLEMIVDRLDRVTNNDKKNVKFTIKQGVVEECKQPRLEMASVRNLGRLLEQEENVYLTDWSRTGYQPTCQDFQV